MPTEILDKELTSEQKLAMNLVTLNTAVNTLQETQAKHHKVLMEGNGELPLVEKVRNHEAFIKEFKYWTRFVFGAMIAQTIAFAIGIVIAVVRFLPLLEKLAK